MSGTLERCILSRTYASAFGGCSYAAQVLARQRVGWTVGSDHKRQYRSRHRIRPSWRSVIPTDQGSKVGVVPIFQAVLPNGKVLMWDSVGQSAPEQMPTNNFTRVMVWDPTNNSYKRVDVSGYNIFCA